MRTRPSSSVFHLSFAAIVLTHALALVIDRAAHYIPNILHRPGMSTSRCSTNLKKHRKQYRNNNDPRHKSRRTPQTTRIEHIPEPERADLSDLVSSTLVLKKANGKGRECGQ